MGQTGVVEMNSVANEAAGSQITREQKWLGIFACFTIVWGLLSLVSFMLGAFVDAERLGSHYSPAQISYLSDTPTWAVMGKAFMACGLLVGSVYLLLRKSSAYFWFMWSLAGTLLVMLDSILRGGFEVLGGMETGVNLASVILSILIFWATYTAMQDDQLKSD